MVKGYIYTPLTRNSFHFSQASDSRFQETSKYYWFEPVFPTIFPRFTTI